MTGLRSMCLAAVLAAAPAFAANMPYGAWPEDQSAFAMGSMVWNVIFVQGDGAIQPQRETWTPAEIQGIQSQINVAKAYWEAQTASFVPAARLSITLNYVNGGAPLLTGYEPSADESEVWINPVMQQLGYTNANRYTNVRNFNNAQRTAFGTNWTTTLFILHNTTANLTSDTYAILGGPYAVLENNAANHGPQNFGLVLAHEMGHIFFALDEYYNAGLTVADSSGYLDAANGNAQRDAAGNRIAAAQPLSLMLNDGDDATHTPYPLSPSAAAMVGLQDTDGDHIPDILDTTPAITGSTARSDPAARTFAFSGTLQVTTLINNNYTNLGFSNSWSDMTIDTITGAYYRLDGGSPASIPAVDGVYGGYSENIAFSLPHLSPGAHTIDIYGTSNVGNDSATLHYTFTALPEPATLAWLGMGLMVALRRRAARS